MDSNADNNNTPHRRYNPLSDRWILVSPQRTQRPWGGQQETISADEPGYLADCYLCPGNERAGGATNPDYTDVFVFDNDYPALLPAEAVEAGVADPLLAQQPVAGRCRVICYSPRHDLTMASMDVTGLERVIDTWASEVESLSTDHACVQVFENRGAAMGCSNMHPHGQVWALDALPSEAAVEDRQQRNYFEQHKSSLLSDYRERELAEGDRIVCSNAHWVVLVPWWAVWPFEVLLLPRFAVPHLPQLKQDARRDLALILGHLLRAYNQLFSAPFPYSMGWHGSPYAKESEHWLLHAHFYPPLLRSATVRKHMVGFEMLGEAQRDLTPEAAAQRLREVIEP